MKTRALVLGCLVAACHRVPPQPELTIVGESARVRLEAPRSERTVWFDGERVALVAARGEVLGLQVIQRVPLPASLAIAGVTVDGFDVGSFYVPRPSTAMYGGSQGSGTYPDRLQPSPRPTT